MMLVSTVWSQGELTPSDLDPNFGNDNHSQISSRNLAFMKPVNVSNSTPDTPSAFAVDGDRDTYWGAGGHPLQWIEVDLQTPVDIERITLITSQYPEGQTVHKVWGKASQGQYVLLHEFTGNTNDDEELTFTPSSPWLDIEFIKIETTESPSWVSWREIEVFGIAEQTEFIQVADDNWHFETSISQQPFIPFGVNYYDPETFHSSPYPAYDVIGAFDAVDVDRQLSKVRDLGANIVRIFISVSSFEPELFVLNDASFQTLDNLINIAKQHRLRIIFDLVNDWEGSPSWESWEYYAEETTLQGYEFYLEALGTRYADEPAIFSWSLKNEPYVRGPDSGIMGDLWIAYVQFKYNSEANLSTVWSDYPRTGETWEQIKQPNFSSGYVPLNSPGHQRLYDYQLFREDIAYNWVRRLTAALRRTDPNHMITIGLDQHSAPIKHVDGFEKTYTGFNPQKIAPLLDYSSMHAYNWWDNNVAAFIEGIARYCYANKPVVVEEFNLREAGLSITPLLDSSSGWLHWGTFAVPGLDWQDNLFYTNENVTFVGNTFRGIAEGASDAVPIRAPDVAQVKVDLKLALTSIDVQNDIYQDYINTVSSSGGPVGFTVLNYRRPSVLSISVMNLSESLVIGQDIKISWRKIEWPVLYNMPVSVLLSRDSGDTWETIAESSVDENEFVWTVTGPISNSCVFRVVDSFDEMVYSDNTAEFSISESDS